MADILPKTLVKLLKSPDFARSYYEGFQDPAKFVKYFLDPFTYQVLFELERKIGDTVVKGHPTQQQWLKILTHPNTRECAVKAGSRSGKTFGLALAHLWFLFYRYRPANNIFAKQYDKEFRQLAAAPSVEQAKIVHDYVLELCRKSDILTAINFIQKIKSGDQPEIQTCMNSKLMCRSTSQNGRYILGFFFDFISYDEVAADPANEFVRSRILNGRRIETDGRICFSSTPQGESESNGLGAAGFRRIFNELEDRSKQGDKTTRVLTLTAYDNPVNRPEVLDRLKQGLTQAQIAMEIYGQFATLSNTVFSESSVDNAFKRGKDKKLQLYVPRDHPLTGDCMPDPGAKDKYLGRAKLGSKYYTGVDSAGNAKGDSTVLITLEVTNSAANLVAYERLSKTETYGDNGLVERIKRRLIRPLAKVLEK